MKEVVFTDLFEPFFNKMGLRSFDDFFNYSGGQTVNKNSRRDVRRLTFQSEGKTRIFYLKRFHKPHIKDMLFTLTSFGRPCSQAECEFRNANLLLQNGIDTYKPACSGWHSVCGIERRSFLITEQLKSRNFTDFLAENWRQLTEDEKQNIIVSMAKTVRKIHDARICLPDLYLWHLFISRQAGRYDFAVIDLHRARHSVKNRNELLKNLGRLHHSMSDKHFDDRQRRLLIESYAGDNWPGGIDNLIAKVERFSAAVSAKRNPKPY